MKHVYLEKLIKDVSDYSSKHVCIELDDKTIALHFDGYGTYSERDIDSFPVIIEIRNGIPFLVIWSDINREDPTHVINLAGAASNLRCSGTKNIPPNTIPPMDPAMMGGYDGDDSDNDEDDNGA